MNQNNYNPQYTQMAYAPVQPNQKAYKKIVQRKEKREIVALGLAFGTVILAYLILQSIAISALHSSEYYKIYEQSSAFQYLFNVIAVHIFSMLLPFGTLALLFHKKYTTPIVPTKKVGVLPFWSWVAVGLSTCYFADIAVSAIIVLVKQFGYELTKGEYLEPSSTFDCIAIIISTAIIPAIIEEISLRCFGMGLFRKHGKGFAMFAISIVFGLLHGNVIQFIFAFVIGLILAYITIQTDSIIPAMIVHGMNNGLSVLNSILQYGAGEKVARTAVEITYFVWLVCGGIGLLYLVFTKRLLMKKDNTPKSPYKLGFFRKLLCLTPGMFVPILLLIYLTSKTIVKI